MRFILFLYLAFFINKFSFGNDKNYEEIIVTINLNYQDQNIFVTILRDNLGNIFMESKDIIILNLKEKYLTNSTTIINNKKYLNLNSIPGLSYNFNSLNLQLKINILPDQMKSQLVLANEQLKPLDVSSVINPGLFINYDVNFSQNLNHTRRYPGYYNKFIAGFADLNYFCEHGILSNSMVFRTNRGYRFYEHKRYNHRFNPSADYFTRLETNWTFDDPENIVYYRIGDSITKPAYWSSSSRFIGVQYSKDFSLRPDIITHPLLNFTRSSELPSAIEVFNKGRKLYSGEVKSGEFNITGIPVITGRGELEVKVKDIIGQTQTLIIPYYIAPNLLQQDLSTFSMEAGIRRLNYATESNNYRDFLTNFDYMRGITDYWTTGAHLEIVRNFSSFGITNNVQLGDFGIAFISLASNLHHFKDGQRVLVGYSYIGDRINFNINIGKNGKDYYNIYNYYFTRQSHKPTYQISLNYNPKNAGIYSLSLLTFHNLLSIGPYSYNNDDLNRTYYGDRYNIKNNYKHHRTTILSASYSINILKNSFLRLTVGKEFTRNYNNHNNNNGRDNHRNHHKNGIFASLMFTMHADNTNYSITSSNRHSRRRKVHDQEFTISSPCNKPLDWGYQTKFVQGTHRGVNLMVNKSTSKAKVDLELAHFRHYKNVRAGLHGSLVYFDNDLFFTRPVANSFALIKAPGLINTLIYNNNQISGYTNNKGNLLIPEVRAYNTTNIKLHNKDIPFHIQVSNSEQKTILKKKTGTILNFDVKEDKAVQLTLIDATGKFIPVNRTVRIDLIPTEYLVGFNGRLYLTDMPTLNILKGSINEDDQKCNFEAIIPNNIIEPIIDLGVIKCH